MLISDTTSARGAPIDRVVDPAEQKLELLKMLDDLAALPKPDIVQKREPIEWPERGGSI